MRHRLEQIEAFLQVVEHGGVRAAAERLGLAKSVVSKRVTDLERALGVTLFRRSTRGIVPTDAARAFHERARAILADLDEATSEAVAREGRFCGSLRIAAPMSFGTLVLGPILFPFFREHPDLEVELDLDDRTVDVVGLGYDLAIRIGPVADTSLVAKSLGTSRRVVCCSPDYARRAGLPKTLAELEAHPAIAYAYRQSSRTWQFEPERAGGKVRSVSMRHRILANNGESMRDAAAAGLGVALLPLFIAAAALRAGTLIDATPGLRPLADPIAALYPKRREPSPKIRALVDHLRAALRDPPWERGLRPARDA